MVTSNSAHKDEPRLIFFTETPEDWMLNPPLASSLQHFETSLILLSIGQFPHALVTCASAIESALKAAINAEPEDRHDFLELRKKARQIVPSFTTLSNNQIKKFRDKRNSIIHFGYSPRDDEICAVLLLETGFRLLEQCYQSFFQYSLTGMKDEHGGLRPVIGQHVKAAWSVFEKAKESEHKSFSYCLLSLRSAVRWMLRGTMVSEWQIDLLLEEEASGDAAWELKNKQKENLKWEVFDPFWQFHCCICGDFESFVCELDNDLLDEKKISVTRGICVNCDFVIPLGAYLLADELFGSEYAEALPRIIDGYRLT